MAWIDLERTKLAPPLLGLTLALLVGCASGDPSRSARLPATTGAGAPELGAAAGPASSARAVANTPLRDCIGLPPRTRGLEERGATNSDHTQKVLGPAPPAEPGRSVLFRYEDFGPQALAGKLLGSEWWSWEPGGSFEPGDAFDVRVVVFQKEGLAEVAARYPTVRPTSDYRLVSREDALRFLDEAEAELRSLPKGPDEYDFSALLGRLTETRRTIVGCLPE